MTVANAAPGAIEVDVQTVCSEAVPPQADLQRWVEAAISPHLNAAVVTVRLVSETEMRALNRQYRGRDAATNVLAFAAQLPAAVTLPLLGDIVLCPAVVAREAAAQQKTAARHWAHLLVHGSLHLLGYDHQDSAQAERMEALETTTLRALGWPCPYHATSRSAVVAGNTPARRTDRPPHSPDERE